MYIDKYLTEKDLLKDLIYSEKQISSFYNQLIMESSCPELRKVLLQCQSTIHEIYPSILDALEIRGWNNMKLINEFEFNK